MGRDLERSLAVALRLGSASGVVRNCGHRRLMNYVSTSHSIVPGECQQQQKFLAKYDYRVGIKSVWSGGSHVYMAINVDMAINSHICDRHILL